MERKSCAELTFGIKSLCKVFPNIEKYISPTLSAFNSIQTDGNLNLHPLQQSNVKLWQTSICVNAETSHFHNENDCTYTIITTPVQDSSEHPHEYNFIAKLMPNHNIGIKLEGGMTFLFSGKYLTHRQSCNINITSSKACFFNIVSYGNERLYNHLKSTLKRVKG